MTWWTREHPNYFDREEFDDDDELPEEEYDPGEDCGRWNNGRLMPQCTKAGSEFCDWDCPYSR